MKLSNIIIVTLGLAMLFTVTACNDDNDGSASNSGSNLASRISAAFSSAFSNNTNAQPRTVNDGDAGSINETVPPTPIN